MRQNVEKNLEKDRQFFHKQLTRKCHNGQKKPSEFTTLATFCQIGKSLDLEDKFYSAFKVEKTGKKNSCCTENSPGNCQTFRNKTAFSIQKHQQTKYSKPFHCVVHKALFKSYNYSTYVHAIVSISKRVSPQRP